MAAPALHAEATVSSPRGFGDAAPDDAGTAHGPNPRPRSAREALLVRFWIGLTVLMVVLMLSVIYARWLTVTEPTAAIVVYGDPGLDGARVYVRAEDGRDVLAAPPTLDPSNEYVTPVLLVPGSYTLRAVLDGKVLKELKFHIGPYQGQAFFLSEEAKRRAAETAAEREGRPRRVPSRAPARQAAATTTNATTMRIPARDFAPRLVRPG
jgi:hypothetical protein